MQSRLNNHKKTSLMVVLVLCSSWILPVFSQDVNFIAGTQPDQRPGDAPIIKTAEKSESWYQQALMGIQQPYPSSVINFLEDQGNWHTPFNQPGMIRPYDLRGWHHSNQ